MQRIRVLCFPRYTASGPSSRYRFYQFLPGLSDHKIDVTLFPLHEDDYVKELYVNHNRDHVKFALALAKRMMLLLQARNFDIVWIAGELFPWLPSTMENALSRLGVRLVVDYDDALFHRYDQLSNPVLRTVYRKKIDRVMAAASLVVVGNDYLAERATVAGAKRIARIPTVIDLSKYPSVQPSPAGEFTVGWIGSPVTQSALESILPALPAFCAGGDGHISAIGASEDLSVAGCRVVRIPWTEETEIGDLSKCHVGVMPLIGDAWSRGKCGFKLIQYMGCHLPVVASPIGANAQIVVPGETGLFASNGGEWLDGLCRLRADEAYRRRLGAAGRIRVERNYSLEAVLPRLAAALRSAADRSPRSVGLSASNGSTGRDFDSIAP